MNIFTDFAFNQHRICDKFKEECRKKIHSLDQRTCLECRRIKDRKQKMSYFLQSNTGKNSLDELMTNTKPSSLIFD